MTQKRAEELWPIIKAFAEGKTIQRGNSLLETDGWRDIKEPFLHHFNINDNDPYRIKPTPTLRPWKPEEAVGKIIKEKKTGHIGMVIEWHNQNKTFWVTALGNYHSANELLNNWEQLDGSPCGVANNNSAA